MDRTRMIEWGFVALAAYFVWRELAPAASTTPVVVGTATSTIGPVPILAVPSAALATIPRTTLPVVTPTPQPAVIFTPAPTPAPVVTVTPPSVAPPVVLPPSAPNVSITPPSANAPSASVPISNPITDTPMPEYLDDSIDLSQDGPPVPPGSEDDTAGRTF